MTLGISPGLIPCRASPLPVLTTPCPNALKRDVAADQMAVRNTHASLNGTAVLTSDEDDKTSWTARLGYGQDNWYVNGWYGKDNDSNYGGEIDIAVGSDTGKVRANLDDTTIMSLAGGVDLDKVSCMPSGSSANAMLSPTSCWQHGQLWLSDWLPPLSPSRPRKTRAPLSAFNTLLARNSKVWLEYAMRDNDADKQLPTVRTIRSTSVCNTTSKPPSEARSQKKTPAPKAGVFSFPPSRVRILKR